MSDESACDDNAAHNYVWQDNDGHGSIGRRQSPTNPNKLLKAECSWGGNSRSGAAQTSVAYPSTGSRPKERDAYPAYTPHAVWHTFWSHTRTVVRECCKGDDESLWERGKFGPSPPKNPLTNGHQNLCRWLRRGHLPQRHILSKSV